MPSQEDIIQDILRRAHGVGPRERPAFVRQACGHDEVLVSEVLARLDDAQASGRFWDEEGSDERPGIPVTLVGKRLGPYLLLRSLGSGGMGDVYLAERADHEYQSRVAIKLVRAGLISAQVQGRMRIERQILATLQHPNIAKLLDGGTAPDGTPYLVIEYIEGEPIDVYCDRHRLSIEERLKLFRIVCSAVHCAHQNLIVHRDLKPSNILVTPDGVPKLLDFGIAKLLDERQSLRTLAVTHYDYRVMTPAHASPEQVRGETITTASDIYVLGVLLYELLCGRRPFILASNHLADIERVICEISAPPPSTAVARARHESPGLMEDLAACRDSTAPRLQKRLHGDLDDIVQMAMRKEPERRYGSVEQLSADVGRHLDGLPVLATRDSWRYRTGKFVRRYKLAVGLSAGLAAVLIGFAATTYVQAVRLARERDLVAAQRARAESERERAEQVSSFLVDIFRVSDPSEARGNEIKAREILDRGATRIETELQNQPDIQATLLDTIGRVYLSLGLAPQAEPLVERSLRLRRQLYGESHPLVAASLSTHAAVLRDKGDLDAAEKQQRRALLLSQQETGPLSLDTADKLHGLGRLLKLRGQYTEAEKVLRDSLDIYSAVGKDGESLITGVMNELAQVLNNRGDYDGAEQLYRQALDIDRRLRGEDHPQYAYQLHDLAVVLQSKGDVAAAGQLFVESLDLYSRLFGDEHPETLAALNNYGWFLTQTGQLERAERIFLRGLELDRKVNGDGHAYVGYDIMTLAMLKVRQRDFVTAERQFREALGIFEKTLPADHPYVASALTGLAELLTDTGRAREAQPLLERALQIWQRDRGDDDMKVASTRAALGRSLSLQGRFKEAEPLLTQSYPVLLGDRSPDSAERLTRIRGWIEDLYRAWDSPQRAEAYFAALARNDGQTPP